MSQLKYLCYFVLGAGLLFQGCAHYNLGRGGKKIVESVYIEPIRNETFIPQLQALLTKQVTEALMARGFKVRSRDQAEAVLSVAVTSMSSSKAGIRLDDAEKAAALKLSVGAQVSLWENDEKTQAIFKNRQTRSHFYFINDDASALSDQYQALPTLAKALAESIAEIVVGTWD